MNGMLSMFKKNSNNYFENNNFKWLLTFDSIYTKRKKKKKN